MIGKIAPKGRGFRGLSDYLLKAGRGRIVAGPMAGRTPRELACEFGALRRLNPKLGKAVAHLMLSPAPGDPPLTDAQWQAIAERYAKGMGFEHAPWVAVVHQDTDHQHMHLAACRIDFDGKTVSDANDFRRSEALVRQIEAEFGLIATPGSKSTRRKPPTNNQPPGGRPMTHEPIPPNPFEPGTDFHATWPQSFDPGRDMAELAMVEEQPAIERRGAEPAMPMTPEAGRKLRRRLRDDDYIPRMFGVLGDDGLTKVYRHPQGAVLYFQDKGRIADRGDRLSVLGDMDDERAARRLVALGKERGWTSIQFGGSAAFVEAAMREAIRQHMPVVPQGEAQQAIWERVQAEGRGGMATASGPVARPLPVGAVPVDQDIHYTLADLDNLEDAPPPVPEPMPEPEPPPQGTLPRFLNLRERLQQRREEFGNTRPAPDDKAGVPPGKRGKPGLLG